MSKLFPIFILIYRLSLHESQSSIRALASSALFFFVGWLICPLFVLKFISLSIMLIPSLPYETFLDYRKLTTKQSRAASHLQVLTPALMKPVFLLRDVLGFGQEERGMF